MPSIESPEIFVFTLPELISLYKKTERNILAQRELVQQTATRVAEFPENEHASMVHLEASAKLVALLSQRIDITNQILDSAELHLGINEHESIGKLKKMKRILLKHFDEIQLDMVTAHRKREDSKTDLAYDDLMYLLAILWPVYLETDRKIILHNLINSVS